jgi:hypothetical protein
MSNSTARLILQGPESGGLVRPCFSGIPNRSDSPVYKECVSYI